MSCANWIDACTTYLNGRATPSERTAVEQHLASCAACAREVGLDRAVRKALVPPPALRVSNGFATRVRQAVDPVKASPARRPWLRLLVPFAAAAVALFALLAWHRWSGSDAGTSGGAPEIATGTLDPEVAALPPEDQVVVKELDTLEDLETVAAVDAGEDPELMELFLEVLEAQGEF